MSGQILTDAGSSPGHFLTDEDLCPGHFLMDEDFWMSLPETVRKCPDFYKYKGFKAWCRKSSKYTGAPRFAVLSSHTTDVFCVLHSVHRGLVQP